MVVIVGAIELAERGLDVLLTDRAADADRGVVDVERGEVVE